ncbi:uncharacterized protein LOC100116772 [Nasonia vitripennis]|uniref:Uncharacterized protein n=1 Tax=Nasonia vitripennis TaxID=7425 RepID=A0A7M7G322_NASVI|nr:uncharacterized protein LOC100116772 [Nasonia vitripennis]XP_032457037.1 uncharacterized protein LOC100116772 [Nasonia vitripennis]XP_032457038.1 uncharacterized protein LOC100116772 [Nasonia vitripennis]XP_032457039.1 uncharacterized protein LOC100116772 [Nasonia vitripennis]
MEPVHQPTKTKELNSHIGERTTSSVIQNYEAISLESLRKIIGSSSGKNSNEIREKDRENWESLKSNLLHLLCTNNDVGNETVLLTSHAYVSLLRALHTWTELESILLSYFNIENSQIIDCKRIYPVYNIELYQLLICHGFLQLGNNVDYSHEIYERIFNAVYLQCIRYTRYTYFAFKILQTWMQRTSKTDFWSGDTIALEKRLEAVIFSNWDNKICKANIVGIFSLYLHAMQQKYSDFLDYLFYSCVERISWCHVTKYAILAEICHALARLDLLTEPKFISSLFNSLTVKHLCNASTKVYTIISNKLTGEMWKATFGEHLRNYICTWEAEKQYSALQVLCKCWLEPEVKKRRDLLAFLSDCCSREHDDQSLLYLSHLLRIGKKYGIPFSLESQLESELVLLEHEDEFVRLNAFAAHCYDAGPASVAPIKHFLYYNATVDTGYLRQGALNYFRIFFSNLLKTASARKNPKQAIDFLAWLREFQLDCFEMGSCYQRKIFGLHLFKISLEFLNNDICKEDAALLQLYKDPNFKEAVRYGPLLRRQLQEDGAIGCNFTDKEILVLLFKLVLDTATDIKELAAAIIVAFFDSNIITDSEKLTLLTTALNKCNSCKFFETDSGACLLRILTTWFPLNSQGNDKTVQLMKSQHPGIENYQTYTRYLFDKATQQFELAKKDIFKAATQETPFYGLVLALFLTGFSDGPEAATVSKDFLEQVISMIEQAVTFFLNALSSKSSNLEYSSSFEEMGLAIDEAIKSSEINYEFDELVLSPAQQSIITCIWRSLKVLCELAVEVAKSKCATDAIISRAGDVILAVSLKCRHKGVIESAGIAIGYLSRYLCQNNEKKVKLLEQYVQKLLNNDYSTSLNLTRRGAGLTITFHKIVANDTRSERQLLHLAVNLLLQRLRESSKIKFEHRELSNYDEPCTMQLHFLKSLVADKQLQAQLSPYMENICLTCFEYMPSRVFTVRNASLQLFGAIANRLVGQNTGARSADFGYGYSINYFASHFPQLAAHVLLSLQSCCQPLDKKKGHCSSRNSSNIIHVLSLLSKMFLSGCELIDGSSIAMYIKQLRSCLNLFLASPVAQVRILAAKSFVATVGLVNIDQEIRQFKSQIASCSDFNRLNGYLYTLEYLYEKQEDELQSMSVKHKKIRSLREVRKNLEIGRKLEDLWGFWSKRSILVKQKKLCYAVEAQLLRLSRHFKIIVEENSSAESKKKNDFYTLYAKTRPGFFEFVDELMRLLVSHMSYSEDYSFLKFILSAKCIDFGVNLLKYAPRYNRTLLITSLDFAISYFDDSHQLLLEEICAYSNESIRQIFRGKHVQLQYADICKLKSFVSKLENRFTRTIQISELLTLIHVLSLRGSETYDPFEGLISCISKEKITLANYFSYPETFRQLIAKGLEILLYNFDHLNDKNRYKPVLASLILMKDEVFSIRQTIRDSVLNNIILTKNLSSTKVMDAILYHTMLLNLASEKTLLGDLSNGQTIEFFEKYLHASVKHQSSTFDIANPFDCNTITPYNEESKLINFIVFCMQQRVTLGAFTKGTGIHKNISDHVFNARRDFIHKMNINTNNLEDVLNINYDKYLAQKLKVVMEMYLKRK